MRRHVPLALLLTACTPGARWTEDPPPSVLLITLDTTRADRLGAYGYPNATTPTWDRLASRGTLFTRAYTVQPLTIPAHASLMTGRVPPSHGVRDNGDFLLGEEAVTLAERYRDAGYYTAAFTSAFPTHRRWGFDQGFDHYSDPLERLPTQLDWRDQRLADEVVEDALGHLRGREGPVFVWVHFFDAHWPYDPPEPFRSQHAGRLYDGEIAFVDHQAAALIDWFESEHPDSIVAVTADHGEALGDGGEQTHGFLLHDGTIRVPLILAGPGVPINERRDDPVSTIDIAPTLLDLSGIRRHRALQGENLLDGGTDVPYHEAMTGMYSLGLAPLHAFTEADGRYTEGAWGAWYPVEGERVLLDPAGGDLVALAADLDALMGSFDARSAETATLDQDALQMLTALGYVGGGNPVAEAGTIDPRDVIDAIPLTWRAREWLGQRMLGPAGEVLSRLDDRMPGAWGVDQLRAQLALAEGRTDDAESLYTDLFLRAPTSTIALQLAAIAGQSSEWAEAEAWYAEALALQPRSPEAMAGLVRAVEAQDRMEEAEALANRFLLVYPDHAELVLLQAEMLLLQGMPDQALDPARRALAEMPWSAWAHTVTGQALWETGQPDPAIERLIDAVRLQPYDARIRLILADCLMEVQRTSEAVRLLAPLAELFPDEPEIVEKNRIANEALAAARAEKIRAPGTGYESVLPFHPEEE